MGPPQRQLREVSHEKVEAVDRHPEQTVWRKFEDSLGSLAGRSQVGRLALHGDTVSENRQNRTCAVEMLSRKRIATVCAWVNDT